MHNGGPRTVRTPWLQEEHSTSTEIRSTDFAGASTWLFGVLLVNLERACYKFTVFMRPWIRGARSSEDRCRGVWAWISVPRSSSPPLQGYCLPLGTRTRLQQYELHGQDGTDVYENVSLVVPCLPYPTAWLSGGSPPKNESWRDQAAA